MNLTQRMILRIAGIVIVLLGLSLAGFSVYVAIASYAPESEVLQEAREVNGVRIHEKFRYTIIKPVQSEHTLIYYPGGLVRPESYIPNAVTFALEQDTTVYIPRVPYNAAIFGIWMADWISFREELDTFWVGGHSLGGIAACRYVNRSSDRVEGLLLHGSYCDQDISDFSGEVISIMGDNDQIINRDNYESAKTNLPDTADIIEVEGLNHSAFGSYGLQKGDGESQYRGNVWGMEVLERR